MVSQPRDVAAAEFAAVLASWRTRRHLSMKQLAGRMDFDASYVSHVEGLRHKPTEAFALRAEAVLDSNLEIIEAFKRYIAAVGAAGGRFRGSSSPTLADITMPVTLEVDNEVASLSYSGGRYRCTVERLIHNIGNHPVTYYPVRIDVDRFPNDPQASRAFYRGSPLRLSDLHFTAELGDEHPEPMRINVKHDHDAFKKLELLFENDTLKFPLYPNEKAVLRYSYSVPAGQYGRWFQREIRFPTRAITMNLMFPRGLQPQVSRESISYVGRQEPEMITSYDTSEDVVVYSMQPERVLLTSQLRMEWTFPEDTARDHAA